MGANLLELSLQRFSPLHCPARNWLLSARNGLGQRQSHPLKLKGQPASIVRAAAGSDSEHLQASAQEQHQGIDPSVRPQAPSQRSGFTQLAGIALGIAVFSAAIWSLVTVWKRKDDKIHSTAQRLSKTDSDKRSRSSRGNSRRGSSTEASKRERKSAEELAEIRGSIICHRFASTGECKFGDNCWYSHEVPASADGKRSAHSAEAVPSKPQRNKSAVKADPKKGTKKGSDKAVLDKAVQEREGSRHKDLKALYEVHGTFEVPVEHVYNIGALMGYRGARIKGLCHITKTEIIVPKEERQEGKPVSIDIYAHDEAALKQAQEMIGACFLEERKAKPV